MLIPCWGLLPSAGPNPRLADRGSLGRLRPDGALCSADRPGGLGAFSTVVPERWLTPKLTPERSAMSQSANGRSFFTVLCPACRACVGDLGLKFSTLASDGLIRQECSLRDRAGLAAIENDVACQFRRTDAPTPRRISYNLTWLQTNATPFSPS